MAFPIFMPKLGMIMTEGTIAKWHKRTGEQVQKGEPLLEVQTDKITYEVTSQEGGTLHIVVPEQGITSVGETLAYLLAPGEAPPLVAAPPATATAPTVATSLPAAPQAAPVGPIRATPAARRLAREMGIDLAQVRGTGPEGRIDEDDVRSFKVPTSVGTPAQQPAPPQELALMGEVAQVIPLRGMRRTIAQRMAQSLQASAQYSLSLEVDMTEAERLRRELGRDPAKRLRVTTADIIIKAVAEALKRHPRLNSAIIGDEIQVFKDINIGMAVALNEGLVVPTIKNADKKSLEELSVITRDLTQRAEKNQLSLDELTGATFNISVLGTVDAFTPILNPPACGILGAGRIVEKAVVHKGQIAPRSMMTLSLTVDHRAVDGAPAASFLRRLQRLLEQPDAVFGKAPANEETEPE